MDGIEEALTHSHSHALMHSDVSCILDDDVLAEAAISLAMTRARGEMHTSPCDNL
jgi:hypothetical protein